MAKAEIVKLYGSFTTEDEYGRNGKCLGYSYDKKVAEKLCQDKGWYGGNGNVEGLDVILINGEHYLLSQKEPIEQSMIKDKQVLIDAAMQKLTNEEAEALGLDKT